MELIDACPEHETCAATVPFNKLRRHLAAIWGREANGRCHEDFGISEY